MGRYSYHPDDYSDAFEGQYLIDLALGTSVMAFEELDEQLSTAIAFLLKRGDDIGRIVTAETSFRAKVNLWSALLRYERPKSANLWDFQELAAGCLEVEEKRNQLVHSKWQFQSIGSTTLNRVKYTARGKHGLRLQSESMSPARVRSVGVHCGFLAFSVDELMYREFGEAYGHW